MSFRKRNKIKIPSGDIQPKQNKNKISLTLSSDEENDDDMDLIPLKPKVKRPITTQYDSEEEEDLKLKPMKSKVPNPFLFKKNVPKLFEEEEEENNDDDDDILYQDELEKLKSAKHEPKQVIMNMEDMVEAGEISDNNEPIVRSERLTQGTIRHDEKEYVKSMGVDDKLDLFDNLTHGGKVKISDINKNDGEYEYNDDIANNEFMDERLALSKNEQIRQAKTRRQQIEEALSNTPMEDAVEVIESKSMLPELYNDEDNEDINDIIHQNKLLIRKKEMELKVLTREYNQLKSDQIELISRLDKIVL
ncbi:pre-mRNA-splicing factor Ntr2p [Monosporozyma unispora]|nr:hypothetical protein C6P44_005011 [Kazachstania unispora]